MATCFTLTELKRIAREAKVSGIHKYERGDNEELLSAIHAKLKIQKPYGPKEYNKKLNTIEILHALQYYEKLYPNFEFMGVFPINIGRSYSGLETLNYRKFKKTNRKFAIVWNTDVSNGPGLHWIAIFIDFARETICYFDSLAETQYPLLIDTLTKIRTRHPNLKIYRNVRPFQNDTNNCGIFVIHFIVSLLQGDTCESFFSRRSGISDEFVEPLRKCLFRS